MQFGVDWEHLQSERVAQKHSDGDVRFFAVQSLPFGATASFSSVLRIAASVKYMGTVGLCLVWTNFFDDYTAICTEVADAEVTSCMESLLKLLGVKLAATGPKAPDLTKVFKTMGLVWTCLGHMKARSLWAIRANDVQIYWKASRRLSRRTKWKLKLLRSCMVPWRVAGR